MIRMQLRFSAFIIFASISLAQAQQVITAKGTKVTIDSSKWMISGNDIYYKNSSGKVGIGTTSPQEQLHTTGGVRFAGIGTNTTDTKILTSDNSGNVTTRLFSSLLSGNALTSLNGLSASSQTFSIGTSGNNFSISSSGSVHTFNLPDASASNRGALTSVDWNTFNAKENVLTFSTGLTRSTNTISVNTSQNITNLTNLSSNGIIKTSGGTGALSIATPGTDYSAGTASLATGILKSTNSTGALTIAIAGDFPVLNQNTTGSAATLTTARSIYGGNFDGSADLTNIIASNFGGTGNGFTKFTGPATSEKTFTLPNASATILTSNTAVTAAQGGTGITSYTTGDLLYASASTTLSKLAAVATGNALISGGTGTAPSWGKIGLTTHVSGVLPIASGGTNSSSTLNNNRIMVSSGGSIIEASALTNGQILIGSTGAAPTAATLTAGNGIVVTNASGSITIANEPSIYQATATSDVTTTSTSDVLLTGMTITPGAGDYLVFFTGSYENNSSTDQGPVSIYKNGSQIAASVVLGETGANRSIPIATNAYVTNLGAGQAIEVKWRVNAGTGTFHQRTLIVQRVK